MALGGVRVGKLQFLHLLVAAAMLPELARWSLNPVYRRDFINFWLSGPAAGAGIDLYDISSLFQFAQSFFPDIWMKQVNFTYPPHALILFAPLGHIPPVVAFIAWNTVSLAFFAWAAKPYLPKGLPLWLVLLAPACLINMRYGQTGLISSGLFLLAFRPNGLAAALLTFKPHLGLLVIPQIATNRHALVLAVTISIAMAASIAFAMPEAWPSFFRHATGFQGAKLASGAEMPWMYKATAPMVGYGLWGWLLFAAGAVYFLSRNYNVFTAATATFLVSPYGFHYDMPLVCLGFLALLSAHWEEMPTWQKIVGALGFLTPIIVDLGTWFVPPILLLGLLVQVERMSGRPLFRDRGLKLDENPV